MDRQDDIDQLRTQIAYRQEEGLSGNHYVWTRGEISNDVGNYMETNNIREYELPSS